MSDSCITSDAAIPTFGTAVNVGSNADVTAIGCQHEQQNNSKQAEAGANDDDRPGLFVLMLKGM
jgi:hypothetical protein